MTTLPRACHLPHCSKRDVLSCLTPAKTAADTISSFTGGVSSPSSTPRSGSSHISRFRPPGKMWEPVAKNQRFWHISAAPHFARMPRTFHLQQRRAEKSQLRHWLLKWTGWKWLNFCEGRCSTPKMIWLLLGKELCQTGSKMHLFCFLNYRDTCGFNMSQVEFAIHENLWLKMRKELAHVHFWHCW